MPIWMQVVLPIFTALLGGGVGFGFGRLGAALDRRRERLDAEAANAAAVAAERARELEQTLPRFVGGRADDGKGFWFRNLSRNSATDVRVAFNDYPREKVKGLPSEPFALGPMDWVRFRLPKSDNVPRPLYIWIRCAEIADSIPLLLDEPPFDPGRLIEGE